MSFLFLLIYVQNGSRPTTRKFSCLVPVFCRRGFRPGGCVALVCSKQGFPCWWCCWGSEFFRRRPFFAEQKHTVKRSRPSFARESTRCKAKPHIAACVQQWQAWLNQDRLAFLNNKKSNLDKSLYVENRIGHVFLNRRMTFAHKRGISLDVCFKYFNRYARWHYQH